MGDKQVGGKLVINSQTCYMWVYLRFCWYIFYFSFSGDGGRFHTL